jgi:oxygen-independent coproporphyrinogen-3 oxidase
VFATTSDRLRLAVARHPPAGTARGAVILAHAMMADKRYLGGLASALAGAGLAAYSFDFRGHGESDRPEAWSFGELVERDLPAVVDAVARDARCAAAELGFVGHSLGGLVGVAAFGGGLVAPPRRLALVSTTPWTRRGPARLARLGVAELLAAAARPTGLLPARRLRLGSEDESARYLADFAGWVRRGAWPYLDGVAALRAPALVVVGERDLMCRHADARTIADRLGGTVIWLRAPGGHFGLFKARALWPRVARFMVG